MLRQPLQEGYSIVGNCPDGANCRSLGQDCQFHHSEAEQLFFGTKLSMSEHHKAGLQNYRPSYQPPNQPSNQRSPPKVRPTTIQTHNLSYQPQAQPQPQPQSQPQPQPREQPKAPQNLLPFNGAQREDCIKNVDCIDQDCRKYHRWMKDGKNRIVLAIEESIQQLQHQLERPFQQRKLDNQI